MRYAQSETYYPDYMEAGDHITGVRVGIFRPADHYWLDWNDLTFKASGWTTRYQSLTEHENGVWCYSTGWALPNADATYREVFEITDGADTWYEFGRIIVINDPVFDLSADVTAIKNKTDNLPVSIKKNVALNNFEFLMVDSADHITPKTGLTVSGYISKDGGAFSALTNSVTEISNGIYKVNLTQAEMNADVITLRFTATGADDRFITIFTDA